MKAFFEWIVGGQGQVAISGAAGGLVRWLTLKTSLYDGVMTMIIGTICAIYLGPLALPILEYAGLGKIVVEEVNRATFSGFIIGIGGIGVASFVIDVLAKFRQQRKET